MVKWLFLLILLFLSPGSTVTFIIVDSSETPVEGAEIYFCARRAVTDGDGTATFKDIPDLSDTPYGGCTLQIQKEGYATVTDALAVTEDVVLTYVLYSGSMGTVSGSVYFDSTDNPAPFVAVRIYDVVTGESLPPVLTDDEGRFSFDVSVDRSVYVVISDYEDQRFYMTPGKDETLVVNTKGIVTDVHVSARDEEGRPLEAVFVKMVSGSLLYEGETDSGGIVILTNVQNGEYTITVEKEGYNTAVQNVSVLSQERGGVFTVDVALAKTVGTVTVQVLSQSGEAISSRVMVTQEGKEIVHLAVSGSETITLEPGMYTVAVTAVGFEPAKRQVLILKDQASHIDFYLEKSESERIVRVQPEKVPTEVLLLTAGAVLIVVFLYLWKR